MQARRAITKLEDKHARHRLSRLYNLAHPTLTAQTNKQRGAPDVRCGRARHDITPITSRLRSPRLALPPLPLGLFSRAVSPFFCVYILSSLYSPNLTPYLSHPHIPFCSSSLLIPFLRTLIFFFSSSFFPSFF